MNSSRNKNILFFSRSEYSRFFPKLVCDGYDSYHVVMNNEEKRNVQSLGGTVVGCFEEEYDELESAEFSSNFLRCGLFPDRFLGWLTLDERREILGKSISFWEGIFSSRNYHACVHETVSFEPEEVLSVTAKKFNCKDLTFLPSLQDNMFYWKDSPYSSTLSSAILNNVIPSSKNQEDAEKYVEEILASGHNPFYVRNLSRSLLQNIRGLLARIVRSFLRNIKFRSVRRHESIFYYDRYWIDYYNVRNVLNVFRKGYDEFGDVAQYRKIYFPLHFEPEAVLLYFAPKYSEQALLIQEIAKVLPADCVLVVKEHPQQKGILKTGKYRDLKRKNSNIIFLPGDYPSIEVLDHVDTVVTIASSVGLEAIIHKVPTIVFGNVFYDKHPAVYHLKAVDEFKRILSDSKLRRSTLKENIEFISKFIAKAKRGTLSNRDYYDDAENINNVVQAIKDEI